MTDMASAVAQVAATWLRESPGLPLVLRAGPAGIEARIGVARGGARISAAEAAGILGVSRSAFYRNHFFGLARGSDGRFSRLAAQRARDRRAA